MKTFNKSFWTYLSIHPRGGATKSLWKGLGKKLGKLPRKIKKINKKISLSVTFKRTDLFPASFKLPAGDIITSRWAGRRLQSQSGAKWKLVFPGENLSAHTRSVVKNALCRRYSSHILLYDESGGARGSCHAPPGAALLPEATPSCCER